MSKRMTKVLSMILTLVMFLSVSTPAFAWGNIGIGDGWDRDIGEDEVRDFDVDVEEEEEEYDYFSTFDEETGINVTVEAPMGALPLLAEVRVEPVDPEAVREAVDSVTEGEREILLAMDISFWLEDDEIEPEEPVRVRIAAPELEGRSDLTVVHIPDEEEPESIDLITDENDLKFELGTNEICFESGDFSVYAVIGGSSNDLKLTVEFYESNTAAEPISTQVLVLEQFDEEGEKPLIDPGVPSLTASQSFEGWKIDDEHKNLDINGLNAYICENYGSMTEDKTLKVYAMVFEVRYIVYHDQAGAVLRTQAYHVELSGGSAVPTSVEIDLPYVPFKGSQNFAGWVLEDKMEVAGDYPLYAEDLGTIYKNETNYTLSETLQLYPYLNSGFWLVFDTYKDQDADETSTSFVAPVFVEEGENTSAPTPPTRTGYRFDGWYKDKNLTERFIFGSPINEKTTVYAKWTAQTAKYTVVFWQQRNTDTPTTPDAEKEYDFYDSQIRTAHTGATVSIDTANSGETADNRLGYNSASSIGRMGYYFVYNEANTDTAPVVVKGDGSTVLNVYYDRKVITYRFFESNKTTPWTPSGGYVDAANGDYYYYTAKESAYYLIGTGPNASYRPASGDTIYYMYNVNANYYPTIDEADAYFRANYPTLATTADVNTETYSTAYDMRFASSGSLYEYYRFSSNSYYSWIAYYYLFNETYSSGYYAVGTGPDPTAVGTHNLVGGAGENVISGLYGAAVTNWPNPGDGYLWANDDAGQSYNYPLGMMEFVPALQEPSTEVKFYLYTDSGTKIPIYYVGQELGGTNYTVLLTSGYTTASTSNNTRSWYPNETVYGYTVVGYRFGTSGAWTPATPATEIQLPTTNANALYIAFARNTHKFVFYSNNEEVTPEGLPAGTDLNAIPFGASFAPFQRLVPTNGPEGYYFDGWYADPSCGTPFDFSATMPDSNVRVYAKWTQIRFRMVCDPRGGDESINPADIVIPNGQATTFCVNYGETVGGSNLNNATREGHTLLGWYLDTDPDNDTVFDTPFDFATPITTENIHADMTYGEQGEDESDEDYIQRRSGVDPWKNNAAYNDQDGEHDDVIGKVTVYARWREDPDGVIGINVRYDAVQGEGTINGTDIIRNDPNIYADQAQAYAQPASIPNAPAAGDPAMKFLYWDILDKEGNSTGRKAYPGQTWEVHFADAKEEAIDSNGLEEPTLVTFDTPIPKLVMPGDIQAVNPGQPMRATQTYRAVTTPTEGKQYLITYTTGNTAYIMSTNYYNNGSYCPLGVAATVSNGTITGDYNQYLFGVGIDSNGYYQFGNLTRVAYLGETDSYYPYYGSNYSTWELTSEGYLRNSKASSYRYLGFNNGSGAANKFFNNYGSATNSKITFYELVEAEPTGEEFFQTNDLKVGGKYVIAIGDYAVGNSALNSSSNDHFIKGIKGKANSDSFIVPTSEVGSATWEIVSGDATNGFIFKNVGNGTYLGMSSDGECYLAATSQALASSWTYDNGTDLNNHVTESANQTSSGNYYYYLSFSSSFLDFTTSSGSGQGVKIYTATTTYTVTFKDGRTNEIIETQEVEEGGSAIAPVAPDHSEEGWIFTGWDTAYDSITQDLTVTAQYVNKSTLSYTVTFRYMDANGDWITATQTVQHGQAAVDPRDDENFPTPPAGYIFNSWDKRFTSVTGPMTINAVYKQVATTKYVVTLRAVYGRADAGSITQINWYSNTYDGYGNPIADAMTDTTYKPTGTLFPSNTIEEKSSDSTATFAYEGNPTFGEHGYNLVYDNVEIPESVLIPEKPYDIPGYTFKGWARIPTTENIADFNLNEDEIYIKWVEDNAETGAGHYEAQADGGGWVRVTYVAANEQKPYHDMYAVWEGSFQIYHSGVAGGAVETVPINFKGTYNLADRVTVLNNQNRADDADKFLYGGYYLEGGFTAPAEVEGLIPAYDGTNWTWKTAQTENGMSMTPKGGETYYIKEVPANKYLQPYIHYTYDKETGEIATAWLISDFDDSMYKETGFVIVKADKTANVCSSLTVQNKVGGASVVLKPETVFRSQGVTKGYLSYLEVISHFEQTELSVGDQVLQYWVTPDGLIVTGIVQRVYGNLQNKDSIKDNVTEKTVASTIGVFKAESGELPVEP